MSERATPEPSGGDAIRDWITRDPYGRWLGIELLDLGPGHCRAALQLRPEMLNFQGSPHGSVMFSLADYAFAGACNGAGEAAVALSVTIQFLAAPRPGARLVAEARAERQGRRAGFYAMTVTADDGTTVASCRAVSLRRPI